MGVYDDDLRRADYDSWKLSNDPNEYMGLSRKSLFRILDICPYCGDDVYSDEEYINEDGNTYHYDCYEEYTERYKEDD